MAPRQDIYHLHPYGWETHPEEERFKVTTLDYFSYEGYINFFLFIKIEDSKKSEAVETLKAGLERTLAQVRHFVGRIEKDEGVSSHSFVKRREDTVEFRVQWLDDNTPENANIPTFAELEKANFTNNSLRGLDQWSVLPMTFGLNPAAQVSNRPTVSAFKANMIKGGIVFAAPVHHFAADMTGWAGFMHQLAENCRALLHHTDFPTWDDRCHSALSRLVKEEAPEEDKIDLPPLGDPDTGVGPGVALLFHLPKSKAAQIKRVCSEGLDESQWVSSYSAYSALIWRTIARIATPHFEMFTPSTELLWGHAVNMRKTLQLPARAQMKLVESKTLPIEQPTVAQVTSEWSLSRLSHWIGRLTDSATPEYLDSLLEIAATARDIGPLAVRLDLHPPVSLVTTDHRVANLPGTDFGFGKISTHRQVSDYITPGLHWVYPCRNPSPESDEGWEIVIEIEKRFAPELLRDAEWKEYFEFRGIMSGEIDVDSENDSGCEMESVRLRKETKQQPMKVEAEVSA